MSCPKTFFFSTTYTACMQDCKLKQCSSYDTVISALPFELTSLWPFSWRHTAVFSKNPVQPLQCRTVKMWNVRNVISWRRTRCFSEQKGFLTWSALARIFFSAEIMWGSSSLDKGRTICSAEIKEKMAPWKNHSCFTQEGETWTSSFHFQRGSDQFVSISVSWAQKLSHKRCCSPTSCSCLLQCGSCFTVACVMPELIHNVASLMLLRGSFMHLNMTRTEATQLPLCSCGRWFC